MIQPFYRFIQLALLIFVSTPAVAKTVSLWDKGGEMDANYSIMAATLAPGDELRLPVGDSFRTVTIKGKLGHGNTTWIYDIGDGKALRIPYSDGLFENTHVPAFIEWYHEGYIKLKGTGVPMAKLYEEESDPKKYLVVEKVVEPYTLKDMLAKDPGNPALAKLDDFARSTWQIRKVGDMRTDQIVYTPDRGWILLDFNNQVKMATSAEDATFFNYMRGLPVGLKIRLNNIVTEERKKMNFPNAGKVTCFIDSARRAFRMMHQY